MATAMRVRRDAEPLTPEELVFFRRMKRRMEGLERLDDVDAAEAARLLGVARRTVLDLVRAGELPGAWKPSHNRVRVPLAAIEAYRAARRVVA